MADQFPSAACPHCETRIRIKNRDLIGKKAKCPSCGEVFRIEVDGGDAAAIAGKAAVRPKKPAAPKPSADEFDEFAGLDDFDGLESSAPPVVRGKSSKPAAEEQPVLKKAKKVKRRTEDDDRFPLAVHRLLMIGTGILGGLLGATVWGIVIRITEHEVGYIAIFVGFLVGLGVRLGASKWDYGWLPALTACGIAVVAIMVGKLIGAHLLMAKFRADFREMAQEIQLQIDPEDLDDEAMIETFAHDIITQREEAGEEVVWPDDIGEDQPLGANYPEGVWAQATEQWNKLSPEEQETVRQQEIAEVEDVFDETFDEIGADDIPISELLSPIDVLWFIFAVSTAFRVAAGWEDDD
ncbi:MAG: hypothetical protein KDA75_20780 [Planctomycetaceae bacterium]|nr:hypothetical protein [Planctomycetaceae bacterium]